MNAHLRTIAARWTDPLFSMPIRKFLIIALALVAVTRTAVVVHFADLKDPDLLETGTIARNLIAGRGYAINFRAPVPEKDLDPAELPHAHPIPTAFILPGYVAVMTAVLATCGDNAAGYSVLYLLNILAAIGTGVLLHMLARRLCGDRCARIAVLAYAVYPPVSALAATFGAGPWNQLVMCLGLYLVVRVAASGDLKEAALAGLAGGVWLMFRAEALALAVFFAVWIARRHTVRAAAVYAGFVLLVALPWTVRNFVTFDSFVPLATNAWINIWRGTNPESTGGSFHTNGEPNYFDLSESIIREFKALPVTDRYELDVMEIYKARTISWVKAHPGDALKLYLRKVWMFLTIDTSDARARQLAFLVPHLLLSALTVVGFCVLALRRHGLALLLVPVAFYWLFIPLFHIESRYQLTLSVLHILVAAAFLTSGRRGTVAGEAAGSPAGGPA